MGVWNDVGDRSPIRTLVPVSNELALAKGNEKNNPVRFIDRTDNRHGNGWRHKTASRLASVAAVGVLKYRIYRRSCASFYWRNCHRRILMQGKDLYGYFNWLCYSPMLRIECWRKKEKTKKITCLAIFKYYFKRYNNDNTRSIIIQSRIYFLIYLSNNIFQYYRHV